MGFSYFRSKLSSLFVARRASRSNMITASHQVGGLVQNFLSGFKFQNLNPLLTLRTPRIHAFSPVMMVSLYGAKRFYHRSQVPIPKSIPKIIINQKYLVQQFSRLQHRFPWRRWIRNPRFVLIGSCVCMAVLFGSLEKIPYSNRYHLALSGTFLEKKLGDYRLKTVLKEYEGRILPPTSRESLRVQRIFSHIVQAMHSNLRLQQRHEYSTVRVVDGWKDASIEEKRVCKRGNKLFGGRFSTKNFERLNWKVVVVVNSYVDNAFYFPNGTIVVFTGLIKSLKSDTEVATILAHEVGHGIARHGSELIMRNLCMTAMLFFLPPAAKEIFPLFNSFISRRRELEADYIGLMLMALAGYDPRTAPEVLEKIGHSGDSDLYATHPSGIKRKRKLSRARVMKKAMAIYQDVISGSQVSLEPQFFRLPNTLVASVLLLGYLLFPVG